MTASEPFRDPALPVEDRVADLLARMTTPEKIGQLDQRLLGWQVWRRGAAGFEPTELLDAELHELGARNPPDAGFRAGCAAGSALGTVRGVLR